MKRLSIVTVFILLALQFTCGHVSGTKNERADCPESIEESELNIAIARMNDQHAQFWSASYRLDSVMSLQIRKPRPILTRASDPINY